MSDVAYKIKEVLSETCKSAPEMTHALKIVGDGDMKTGIMIIANYFEKRGLNKGRLQGVAGTLTVVGLVGIITKVIDSNRKNDEEGKQIIQKLQVGINDYRSRNYEKEEKGDINRE